MTRESRVLALVSIASAVSALDLSLMFVAYPSIRADFPEASLSLVSWVLTAAIALVIVSALLHLVVEVVVLLVIGAGDALGHEVFQSVFGRIMTVLIALEFNHTLLHVSARGRGVVQVKSVLLIAMLALSRKLIILDLKVVSSTTVIAVSVALVSLGIAYLALRQDSVPPPP